MQALWMLLASLFFASMGVCIKFASGHFNSFEIVAYRGMVGVVFLIGFTLTILVLVVQISAWGPSTPCAACWAMDRHRSPKVSRPKPGKPLPGSSPTPPTIRALPRASRSAADPPPT